MQTVERQGEAAARNRRRGAALARWAMVPASLGLGLFALMGGLVVVALVGIVVMFAGMYLHWVVLAVAGFIVALLAGAALGVLGPVAVIAGLLQVPTLVLAGAALRKVGGGDGGAAAEQVRRVRMAAIGSLAVGLSIGAVVACGVWVYVKQQNESQHAFDGKEFPEAVAQIVHYAAATEHDHFPPGLAAAALDGWDHERFLSHLKRNAGTQELLYAGATAAAWRDFEPEVEAEVDYRYVGGDLPGSEALGARAGSIVILYSKHSYDGGRTVAFADGHVVFVRNEDLEGVFTKASRHRDVLDLPPVTLDGPSPVAK